METKATIVTGVLVQVPLSLASRFFLVLDPEFVWATALLAALAYSVRSARRSNLDPRSMYWAVVCAILVGLGGGHLLGLLVHGWRGDPIALVQFWQGDKSYYGGLIGGGIAGGLFFYFGKLPVLAYADASMPALALGYAIGRLGCLLNGDDYGTLTHVTWAVVYPAGTEAHAAHVARGWISPGATWSLPVHPVQLYASLLGLFLFVWLASWRPMRPGSRFCSFVTTYGTARFVLEWMRGDFHTVLGPFSLPQLFSLFFVLIGLGMGLVLVSGTRVVATLDDEGYPSEETEHLVSEFQGPHA
jgi:phosphatidylglycerol---prolipoprotein diacylglyceryl transferase